MPVEIGLIRVKSFIFHSNSVNQLPLSLINMWDTIQEVSLDWFSYLLPMVGKKVVRENKQNRDNSCDLSRSNLHDNSLSVSYAAGNNIFKARKDSHHSGSISQVHNAIASKRN